MTACYGVHSLRIMMDIDRIKHKENLIYIWLALVVVAFYAVHIMSENSTMHQPLFGVRDLWRMLYTLLPLSILFLLNNFVLMPRFLVRRRMWLYVAITTVAVGGVAIWLFGDFWQLGLSHLRHLRPLPEMHGKPLFIPMPLMHDFMDAALVVGVNIGVHLVARQVVMGIEREQLMSANVSEQLSHLKTQINPHFYLNMLNSIHGVIDIDPERAKDMIIDMSRLMQYMLYDSARDRIPLCDEVAFLHDYLRVMQRRYPADKVSISVSLPPAESMANVTIEPLLFLVFIENAFKHGVDYRQPSFVSVSMHIDADTLHFECINSRHDRTQSHGTRGGLGLKNIRKRLALLYGNRASLMLSETPGHYSAILNLPLHET